MDRVIISGGGTGGHIFPAVAIADEIRSRYPNVKILFVGAAGRMEMEKVPQAGYEIIGLPIAGIQRKLTLSNLMVPFKLIKSIWKANKILNEFKPQAVIGVGGYASAAVLYAASGKGIPCLIQEQNSYAGLTNKWLSKKVKKICVAYEGMDKFFPKEKIVVTGNPVRKEIYKAIGADKAQAKTSLGFEADLPLVLIVGGSLGARTINNSVQAGLEVFESKGIQVMWQTGKLYEANVAGKKLVKASAFISDMCTAYTAADVVVSRAGALSVSELCLVGKAAILVPSPNVAEDHQTGNALALVKVGAAVMIKDADANAELVNKVVELSGKPDVIRQLEGKIGELSKPDALKNIVNEIETILL